MINFKEYLTENFGNLSKLAKKFPRLDRRFRREIWIGPNSEVKYFNLLKSGIWANINKTHKKFASEGNMTFSIIVKDKEETFAGVVNLKDLQNYAGGVNDSDGIYLISQDTKRRIEKSARREISKQLDKISKGSLIDAGAFELLAKKRLHSDKLGLVQQAIKKHNRNGKIELKWAKEILSNLDNMML